MDACGFTSSEHQHHMEKVQVGLNFHKTARKCIMGERLEEHMGQKPRRP